MNYNNQTLNDQESRRKSVKLKYYDYSTPGLYYITLCTHEKKHLFGCVKEEKMFLNQAGKMLVKWLLKIETKYDGIKCIHHQVMPNHLHGIIKISDKITEEEKDPNGSHKLFDIVNKPVSPTLFDVVGWFKTMSTNDFIWHVKNNGWKRFDKKLWQRSVYEHIIRDEEEYEHAVLYIERNPERWGEDKYNK